MENFDSSRNDKTDEEFLKQIITANSQTNMSQAISFDGVNPDDKIYLGLLSYYSENPRMYGEYERDWCYIIGRQNAYNNLKMLVQTEAIDPNKSFIIVAEREYNAMIDKDSIIFKDSRPVTVYRFLLTMIETGKVLDDGDFDIKEFDHSRTSGDLTIFDV